VTTPQPQQYCLRWNNHQHNLLSVFEDLLNHEAFVDVTIACDGLNLKAHKMVLSACSPYFQSMFYNTPDKHPVVFLKDVRYDEMKALLEFMYRGEVSVDQENLSSLLKVAEGLKIKGLADVNESSHTMSAPRLPLPMPHHSVPAHHHLPAFHPTTGGLLSPESSLKRHLTTSTSSLHHSSLPSPNFLGPKRKRGRPRRLSGSEAVPLAVSLADHEMMEERERARSSSERSRSSPLPLEISESEQSPIKSLKEGSRAMSLSPGDSKANDFPSEADSIDGRSSGGDVSHVSCEPDVVQLLGSASSQQVANSNLMKTMNGKETTSTTIINNRPVTIKTFKLEPGMTLQNIPLPPGTLVEPSAKVKLEPGLLQELPRRGAGPLKVEIHDSLLDSDIDGALIIAEQEELAGNNATLDYVINDNGTCTCKLCGEVTQSRTHWYRHKYKVHNVCLFRCEKCEIFFKSKKGYEGHVANRHTPRILGLDGRLKSKKEIEGLNKEMQAKKEAEMVQKIIEKVKAECKAQGEDVDRRGYTKHYAANC